MKRAEFTNKAAGDLVDILVGEDRALAFVPAPLPPDYDPGSVPFAAAVEARGQLGELVGQARRAQNLALITRPLEWRDAISSNRIEGTYTEPMAVLLSEAGKRPTDPVRAADIQEVQNHFRAYQFGRDALEKGAPLSLHLIRSLHGELLRGVRGSDRHPGEVRQVPVFIGSEVGGFKGARFVPPPPEQLDPLLDDFSRFIESKPSFTALIDVAIQHYQFEVIHPFKDGNGRTGRLLIPLYLLSQGDLDRPVLYLSPFFEIERDEYVTRLKRVSTEGAWEEWVLFFLRAITTQVRDARDRIEVVDGLYASYKELAMRSAGSKAAVPAVDLVLENVVVTVPQLAKYVGCHPSTAKKALEELSGLGIVEPVDDSRPQAWVAQELVARVYE
ncbi:MAG TPA: Fic family protein [Dehalococcoidia bacterium]|nr:Fic family protein [Dehalococcoidia bacterium]